MWKVEINPQGRDIIAFVSGYSFLISSAACFFGTKSVHIWVC